MSTANDLARNSYNQIGEAYLQARNQFKNDKYLERLDTLLETGSEILDIGCGAGKPVAQYFVGKDHRVIGIDISEKQIELARTNVPQARYEVKDMAVDAVVSFYDIFHLRRELHQDIFKKANSCLRKGGYLLATMGSTDWEGTEDNFHGARTERNLHHQ